MIGGRGLLEWFFGWRRAPAAEPPVPPTVPAPRGLVVRAYHGEAGEYLEDWRGLGTVEITFALHGPDTARIETNRHAAYLHHTRSMPGGVGVFLEIDARSLASGVGVPDIWTGRMVTPQFDGDGAAVALPLKGPEEWLSRIGVPLAGTVAAPSARVVRDALLQARAETWVRMGAGSPTRWARIPFDLSGQTYWALMTGLAEQRGEEFVLTPRPRSVLFDLDWRHPLDSPDASGEVTLRHGVNCTLSSSALNTGLPLQDAVGAALSYGEGAEVAAALVKAPPAARVGVRDALTAALSSLTLRRLAGTGGTSETIPAPEITSQAALEAMLEAILRREMVAVATAQVQDVEPRLWRHLRPGTLVGTALPDPFGLFAGAVGRIRTATFSVAPVLGCSLSLDLWSWDAAHA